MQKTKYTFLLPAYKTAFLEEALSSIQSQTYKDFTVIVSDDCSPQPVKEVFDRLCSTDDRFIYRRNAQNIGGGNLVAHWNLLLQACQSEFLVMASDDDVYAPTFLEEIDRLTAEYPQANLYRARVKRINESSEVTAEDNISANYESQTTFLYGLFCLRRLKCIANYVFRTETLKAVDGFEQFPLAWGSDDITVMKASAGGVGITTQTLFSFRLSNSNISSIVNPQVQAQKTMARMQNLRFFDQFIETVKTDGTVLEANRKKEFTEFYLHEWTRQVMEGACWLNKKEIRQCYAFLRKRGVLSGKLERFHFWWDWYKVWRKKNCECKTN